MIKLWDFELSVNCYKARLLMSMLGVEYELVAVDFFPGWEHKSADFKKLNPLGHIPVIDDSGFLLRDAHAILIYLAVSRDPSKRWYPVGDPRLLGETAQWMQFAEGTANTASAARLHDSLGYDFDIEACRAGGHRLFRELDSHLWFNEHQGLDWVCSGAHPTIADVALFGDVALSEEGGISREGYPSLRRWIDRVKRLDGFVPMAGIFPAGPARQ